jgi:hypothetical protein
MYRYWGKCECLFLEIRICAQDPKSNFFLYYKRKGNAFVITDIAECPFEENSAWSMSAVLINPVVNPLIYDIPDILCVSAKSLTGKSMDILIDLLTFIELCTVKTMNLRGGVVRNRMLYIMDQISIKTSNPKCRL